MAQIDQQNQNTDDENQSMSLYDGFEPRIKAGNYRFIVQQSLKVAGLPEHHYYRDQRFRVTGPRYSLPPDDILTTFPPNGATGSYGYNLPHIVLRKRALPWERELLLPNGQDVPSPWLALLVLTQAELDEACKFFDNDLLSHSDTSNKAEFPTQLLNTAAPADLLAAPEQPVRKGLHQQNALLPCLAKEEEGTNNVLVNVLDLPYNTFAAVCPRQADLPYLAHIRCVDTSNKASLEMHADGEFAVLIANRFPQPGANYVYLVSLEGWEEVIRQLDNPDYQPGADRVRLVVLSSWTFVDDEAGFHTFGGLMGNLNASLFVAPLPPQGSGETTADVHLGHGYVPVQYQPRHGQATFAWYRGPFAPCKVDNLEKGNPFARADEALVLDPQAGLLDISYAAAWQLGRLLALASPSFADALQLYLDELRSAKDAASAIQALARALRMEGQGSYADLWRRELQELIITLRSNLLKPEQQEELLDGLAGAGTSRETNQSILSAFREASGDQDLATRLDELGLSNIDIAQLLVISHGAQAVHDQNLKAVLHDIQLSEELIANLLQASQGVQAPGAEVVAGEAVLQWLARLALLYPVPFEYLVAHERLLPAESLRFFHVDNNWLEALLDGSLSIAFQSSCDVASTNEVRPAFHQAISQLVYQYRLHLRGLLGTWQPAKDGFDAYMDNDKTGFLLRSSAIAGWPGTEIRCFDGSSTPGKPEEGSGLTVLRMNRLAPDVLFCLVEGQIGRVVLKEPAEAFRFGVNSKGAIPLRRFCTSGKTAPMGSSIRDPQGDHDITIEGVPAAYTRSGAPSGVLDINHLASDLAQQVANHDNSKPADFHSAAFALQLLISPEMQTIFWQ